MFNGNTTTQMHGETKSIPLLSSTQKVPASDGCTFAQSTLLDTCTKVPLPSTIQGISFTPKKKRICRFPGCTNAIKSQGHCQKHGAIVKLCKIENCKRQAQGKCEGMCKRHWRLSKEPESVNGKDSKDKKLSGNDESKEEQNPEPSVYDSILPLSIAWKGQKPGHKNDDTANDNNQSTSNTKKSEEMPLIDYFRKGSKLEPGWHRFNERRVRCPDNPVKTVAEQLQPEEKQLILFETMLLSGTVYTNTYIQHVNVSKDFAHAWGREKGFQNRLVSQMCERRGALSRKRRSDVGKSTTEGEKANLRTKMRKKSMKEDDNCHQKD